MEPALADSLTGGGIVLSGAALLKIVEMYFAARRAKESKTDNPLAVEQTQQQALWKDNARDHADLFDRMRRVEADVAGHTAAILGMKDMLNKIYDMVSKLYTREVP